MKRIFISIFLVLACSNSWADNSIWWSKDSLRVFRDSESGNGAIWSPDHKLLIQVKEGKAELVFENKKTVALGEIYWPLAEISWSSGSNAFFINASDGGEVGTWHLSVFQINGNKVKKVDVTLPIYKKFQKHMQCDQGDEPNFAGIFWNGSSSELAFIGEVPNHSVCKNMAELTGYIYSMNKGIIVSELSEKEVLMQWKDHLNR